MTKLVQPAVTFALAVALMLGLGVAPVNAAPDAVVPFAARFRLCNHSFIYNVDVAGFGTGFAVIRRSGNKVVADVRIDQASPDTVLNVRLIQMPRSAATYCNTGAPGTNTAPLLTDPAGNGRITVTGDVVPGATGAWVMIDGPITNSFPRGEFYSSDSVAPL